MRRVNFGAFVLLCAVACKHLPEPSTSVSDSCSAPFNISVGSTGMTIVVAATAPDNADSLVVEYLPPVGEWQSKSFSRSVAEIIVPVAETGQYAVRLKTRCVSGRFSAYASGYSVDVLSPSVCSPDSVYFDPDVKTLLNNYCVGCHNENLSSGGVNLSSYAVITADGKLVRPGRPDDSKLMKVVADDDPADRMPPPPASPLSAAQIETIRKWITQGAPENVCR